MSRDNSLLRALVLNPEISTTAGMISYASDNELAKSVYYLRIEHSTGNWHQPKLIAEAMLKSPLEEAQHLGRQILNILRQNSQVIP